MTAEEYIQRLLEISEKKYRLLNEIMNLTRTQSGTINEDNIEELGKIIEEKQKRIDEINKIDEEFGVYFQRLKQKLRVNSLDEMKSSDVKGAEKLQLVVKEVVDKVKEISKIEKQNNGNAKKLLDKLEGELNKISNGKKINSAYKPKPPQTASYFFDRKK